MLFVAFSSRAADPRRHVERNRCENMREQTGKCRLTGPGYQRPAVTAETPHSDVAAIPDFLIREPGESGYAA